MVKKRFLSLALVAVLGMGCVAGCGNSSANGNSASENVTNTEAGSAQSEANESTATAESASNSESSTAEATSDNGSTTENGSENAAESTEAENTETKVQVIGITERNDEMRDITPQELVAEIKAGWNLGNTFDAYSGKGLDAETSWGNPKTTKEMIDAVCEKGFNAIRIPITWGGHMGEAPDYTIDSEWIARVEEVVNYALDDGMYVIINSHHEEDWRIPDNAHIDAVDAQHRALWTQVAEHFKDYGDHLIFEGLNEPRVKGGENEWDGGTEETRACLDRLNQSFVDVVRATGGNNEKRLVLITSYASSHVKSTIKNLQIPEDDHMAVSIHAYTPYRFTYANGQSDEVFKWSGALNTDIYSVMLDLKLTFLDKGIPVLLTEYGAETKQDNDAEISKWAAYYVACATERGIPCFWWDNGIYNQQGEKFGIFNRKNLTWYREEVVDTVIAESYKEY